MIKKLEKDGARFFEKGNMSRLYLSDAQIDAICKDAEPTTIFLDLNAKTGSFNVLQNERPVSDKKKK